MAPDSNESPGAERAAIASPRRQAIRLAYLNGLLWAIGNGLASTSLVVFLAFEYGAKGLGISLVLAAPRLVGVLRLATPALIQRVGSRRRLCLGGYLASAIVLAILPIVTAPGTWSSESISLQWLVVCWCLYHLLEFVATVALWSWLGELIPRRIRGRCLGYRERCMLTGSVAAMLASALLTYLWREQRPAADIWQAYGISTFAGALCMLAALIPLARIPQLARRDGRDPRVADESHSKSAVHSRLLAGLADPRFAALVLFGCWFSFCNGLTQSAQNFFFAKVLGLQLAFKLLLETGQRLGKWSLAPAVGRLCDRHGNKPVLIGSQLLVAAAMLFFAAATPEHTYVVAGAWLLWIAYAGLDIGLPNLMLALSPRERDASFIALYYAASSLCFGLSTILGGWLVDDWRDTAWQLGGLTLGLFPAIFVLGWLLRSAGVLLLRRIDERAPRREAG